jgi:hypothetical protein
MTAHTTTAGSPVAGPVTYVFGRRDRGGVLLGFRAGQLVTLGVGFAALLTGLLAAGGHGAIWGAVVLGVGAVLALTPVQGRVLVDWVRPLANYGYARACRRGRYLGGAAAFHRCGQVARFDLPGVGQHLRVLEADTTPTPSSSGTAGAAHAAHSRSTVAGVSGRVAALRMGTRWTVVLRVRGGNYVLADRASQERRIQAWGALLSQSGQEGSHIAALQWLERTIPDSGHDLAAWWREYGDPTAAYAGAYAALIDRAGPAATRHETYLAVSIDTSRLRRLIRHAGGGPEGTTRVLLAELAWVRACLHAADLEVTEVLDATGLARLVRTQYNTAAATLFDPERRAPSPMCAGPAAAQALWDHYRTDDGVHAVYWIAEWPSVPVEAAWIYPLIALGGVRRTISLTAHPIPPSRSMRELRGLRVAKRADEAQRRRLGQVETAADEEEYAALERREHELVRGHTEYAYTGWITVTAPDTDHLEAECALVEQAAVRSALEVRRVYGEVDQAFLRAALPLAHGVTP